jgi:hypothetical protein
LQGVAGPKGDTGPTGPLGGLLDGAVDTAKLADNAVTSAKVAADTLTAADIATGAVETTEILDSTITIADLAQSVWSSNAHAAGTLAARPPAGASNNGFLYLATDDAGGTLYRSNGSTWTKAARGASETGASVPESVTILNDAEKDFTWASMPAALTEMPSPNSPASTRYRTQYDLTSATQARLVLTVTVAGSASANIRVQYSTNQSTWYYLDGSSGPSVAISSTGVKTSAWVNLTAGAKADVFLRIVGINGNGSASPSFGRIDLQLK